MRTTSRRGDVHCNNHATSASLSLPVVVVAINTIHYFNILVVHVYDIRDGSGAAGLADTRGRRHRPRQKRKGYKKKKKNPCRAEENIIRCTVRKKLIKRPVSPPPPYSTGFLTERKTATRRARIGLRCVGGGVSEMGRRTDELVEIMAGKYA